MPLPPPETPALGLTAMAAELYVSILDRLRDLEDAAYVSLDDYLRIMDDLQRRCGEQAATARARATG